MSDQDENNKHCEWVIDPKTGDTVMKCHDGHEGARIPEEVVKASHSHDVLSRALNVERLQKNIENELHCKLGDDCCSVSTDASISTANQEVNPDSMLCYCYEITWQDYYDNPSLKDYVIEQTRQGNCECEIKNPSGRCCLRDFPKK